MKQLLDYIQSTKIFDKLYKYFNKEFELTEIKDGEEVPIEKKKFHVPIGLINVINSNDFPWNKDTSRTWDLRQISDIKKIIIHQAASIMNMKKQNKYQIRATQDLNKDSKIENWEKNHLSSLGAPHICYHYGICGKDDIYKDGTILKMNDLKDITWGCKGYNSDSLHILVNGCFDGPTWLGTENNPTTESTEKQMNSLKKTLDELLYQLPKLSKKDIYGHCELSNYKDNCPGTKIMMFLNEYRKKS